MTQSAFTSSSKSQKSAAERAPLRGFLMSGDFFVGASLATVLTKLALRFPLVNSKKTRQNVSTTNPVPNPRRVIQYIARGGLR